MVQRVKKGNFNKQLKTISGIPEIFNQSGEVIEKFDDTLRTSEAHNVSRLKKQSLSMGFTGIKNPQIHLSGYWDLLTICMQELDKSIKAKMTKGSYK